MTVVLEAVDGIGEVLPGDDIASLVVARAALRDGDVVVVTSKIVSKAAGLATTAAKDDLLDAQTDRVVARRGPTSIVRTHHGLTMAAAGIDGSNTAPGTLIPLPHDPDGAAGAIRARILELTGAQVAVIVSDTAGRAWRVGQTDIAIGCAGLMPFESFDGQVDPYGNRLVVTAPAIADQLAGAAELASGKLGARPVVIVRGADPAWFTTEDGPGAAALIRDEDSDMFGLGAREAAVAAILGRRPVRGLPKDTTMRPADVVELALTGIEFPRTGVSVDGETIVLLADVGQQFSAGALAQRLVSLGVAHGVSLAVSTRSSGR